MQLCCHLAKGYEASFLWSAKGDVYCGRHYLLLVNFTHTSAHFTLVDKQLQLLS